MKDQTMTLSYMNNLTSLDVPSNAISQGVSISIFYIYTDKVSSKQ